MTEPAGLAAERLISADVMLEHLDQDGGAVALGARTRVLLESIGGGVSQVGLWEVIPGTDTDVEVEEIFVVLKGAGTLRFEDATSIDLKPGTVVRLSAGDRTEWIIHERLRKLYVLLGAGHLPNGPMHAE